MMAQARGAAKIGGAWIKRRLVRASSAGTVAGSGGQTVFAEHLRWVRGRFGKRGKTGGGMIFRFSGRHESDSFWECCRLPTLMAYRMPI